MNVQKCDNDVELENLLINEFNISFVKVAENEYFEGVETDIVNKFNTIVTNYFMKTINIKLKTVCLKNSKPNNSYRFNLNMNKSKKKTFKYECDKCKYYTNIQYNYNRHTQSKIHLNNNNNICEKCYHTFVNKQNLNRHLNKQKICTSNQLETAKNNFKENDLNSSQHVNNIVINL